MLIVALEHSIVLGIVGVGVQRLSRRPVDVLAFSKGIEQGLVLSQYRYDTWIRPVEGAESGLLPSSSQCPD